MATMICTTRGPLPLEYRKDIWLNDPDTGEKYLSRFSELSVPHGQTMTIRFEGEEMWARCKPPMVYGPVQALRLVVPMMRNQLGEESEVRLEHEHDPR